MRPRLAAVLVAGGLVLAACSGSAEPDATAAAPDGDPLGFRAPDVRGGQVVGSDFAGKDLVIWFWAPW